jgi:hypothetical protein
MAPLLLISALDEGEWSASSPCRLTPGAHCVVCWVGPDAGLDAEDKRKFSFPYRGLNLGCPARSLVSTLTELSLISIFIKINF